MRTAAKERLGGKMLLPLPATSRLADMTMHDIRVFARAWKRAWTIPTEREISEHIARSSRQRYDDETRDIIAHAIRRMDRKNLERYEPRYERRNERHRTPPIEQRFKDGGVVQLRPLMSVAEIERLLLRERRKIREDARKYRRAQVHAKHRRIMSQIANELAFAR